MTLLQILNQGGAMPPFLMNEAGDEGGGGAGDKKAADAGKAADTGKADGGKSGKAAGTGDAGKQAQADAGKSKAGDEGGNFLDDDGDGSGGDEGGAEDKASDDWRKRVAGEDEKYYKELQKFPSEAEFGKRYQDLRKQVSKMPPTLAKDATEEEIAAHRKKIGLPEKPEGYEKGLVLPEGMVIGEADKALIGDFLKVAHTKNWSQESVNDAVGWYYHTQKQGEALRAEQEKAALQETKAELREEWGPDYDANVGMIRAWLGRQPGKAGEMLAQARGEDGMLLRNTAPFAKWLAAHIRENEPSATIMQASETSGVSIEEEIRKIQDVIATDPDRYGKDKKMQKRMGELATIKKKMKMAA